MKMNIFRMTSKNSRYLHNNLDLQKIKMRREYNSFCTHGRCEMRQNFSCRGREPCIIMDESVCRWCAWDCQRKMTARVCAHRQGSHRDNETQSRMEYQQEQRRQQRDTDRQPPHKKEEAKSRPRVGKREGGREGERAGGRAGGREGESGAGTSVRCHVGSGHFRCSRKHPPSGLVASS